MGRSDPDKGLAPDAVRLRWRRACIPASVHRDLGYTVAQPSSTSDAAPRPGTVLKPGMAHSGKFFDLGDLPRTE